MLKQSNGRDIMNSNVVPGRRYKVNASDWLLVAGILITCFNLVSSLPLESFYPYDVTGGDNRTEVKDDGGSPPIDLYVSFPFFNKTYSTVYANNNGIISFKDKLTSYKPHNFNSAIFQNEVPLVAPYWADVDIENVKGLNETIVYRLVDNERSDSAILNRASRDVRKYFKGDGDFSAKIVLIVTWYQVGFYGATLTGKSKRNTFQTVLITDGQHSYAIFNYNNITWTTGSNSGGDETTGLSGSGGEPAVVGFHSGGDRYYIFPQSGTPAVLNISTTTNVDAPGLYVFRIDGPDVNNISCWPSADLVISPTTVSMLGGEAITLRGPCFTAGQVIEASIPSLGVTFPCEVELDASVAICVMPSLFRTGELTLVLNDTDSSVIFNSVHIMNVPALVTRRAPDNWWAGRMVTVSWQDVDHVPAPIQKEVQLLGYTESGSRPEMVMVGNYSVDPGATHRQFRMDTPRDDLSTLVIKLCWSYHHFHIDPVCIWSDVFPVQWSTANRTNMSQGWCEQWIKREQGLPGVDIHSPYCPCVASIAERDVGHFHKDSFCDNSKNSDNNCEYNPNAHKCFRRNIKSATDSGETCCYDGGGNLMDIRESPGAGTHQRYHIRSQGDGIVPFFSYFEQDILPRFHCCQQSSALCEKFIHYRPATTCQNYSAPSPAQAAGDPHLVTLDGRNYSFNGVGDFYLVMDEASSTVIQVRAIRATDKNGDLQNATVFSSVGVRTAGSDSLEIRKPPGGTPSHEVLLNGAILITTPSTTSQFKNISLTHTDEGEFLVVLEPVSVSVTVQVTPDLLNIITLVGEDSMKGSLRGLLGNYNGDSRDDFRPRYTDAPIPADSSMRDIHFRFGMTWLVPANESIMSDPPATPPDEFTPLFIDEHQLSLPNDTDAVCADNIMCRYDYAVTKKESIAKSTAQFTESFKQMQANLSQKVIRCPYLAIPENGNKTQSNNSLGGVATFTCDHGFEVTQGTPTRTCQDNEMWDGEDVVCAQKLTPKADSSVILIAAMSGTGGFIVFAIAIAVVICRWRKTNKNKEPDPAPIPLPIWPPPVSSIFESSEYRRRLQTLFNDGRYALPRPKYVSPQVYDFF